MAIPNFTDDLAIISKLGENPGTDNGLTTAAFRAKFDEAALLIQKYINEVLVPNSNATSSPDEGLSMKGPINMNGEKLSGLPDPATNADAATKQYVDTKVAEVSADATGGISAALQAAADANTAAGNAQATANDALTLAAVAGEGIDIPEGADLNNYTTPGVYRCATSTIAATLLNAPTYTGAGFRVIVSAITQNGNMMQTYIFGNTSSSRIYWRIRSTSGTWGEMRRVLSHSVGFNEELWTGSWESGTITVPNTADYKMFLIAMDGVGTLIPVFRYDEYIRGVGGYSTSAPAVSTYQFAASYNGNKWTLAACNSITHSNGSNHGTAASRTVARVIGFL